MEEQAVMTTSPPDSPQLKAKVFDVKLKDIIVAPDRGRKTFTRIIEMSESIKKFGLIHPIVVCAIPTKPGKYELIAGERRFRGALLAGVETVPASLRDGSESLMAEIELEENLCRDNISWEEECHTLAKIQERKKKEIASWTIEQTAQMTNRSLGDVSTKIKMSKKLKERPELKKLTDGKPFTAAIKIIDQKEDAEKVDRLVKQGQIELSTDLREGDCRNLIRALPPQSIDMLLTVPPYGIAEIEDLRSSNQGDSTRWSGMSMMSATHNLSIDEVCKILGELAPELHRVMKPGAHFYIFTAAQYIGRFLDAVGPFLEFQPPVLLWERTKTSVPGFGYNYQSKIEFIIYGHREPRSRRLNEFLSNRFECPDVPKNLRMYPTEKPVPLLQSLIKNSTQPGHTVLDPFAGSASTLIAARESGRKAIGFEIDHNAFLRAQQRLLNKESI